MKVLLVMDHFGEGLIEKNTIHSTKAPKLSQTTNTQQSIRPLQGTGMAAISKSVSLHISKINASKFLCITFYLLLSRKIFINKCIQQQFQPSC